MADYEPFPTGANEVDDRSLRNRILGCFGCGGLSVLGFFGVVVLLVGGLGGGASGCDVEAGPGEGTASARLPVAVAPTTGLSDGTSVRVTSDAFGPNAIVGVAVCLRSADTERRGVDACAEDQGARYATTKTGQLDATYAVPRVITVGGRAYDCAAKAARCIVVAADANDYDRSGGQAVTFRTGLTAPDLTPVKTRPATDHLPIGAEPAVGETPLAAGTPVTVLASGFQPGEPLLIAYCSDELEAQGVIGTCDPVDSSLAITAIMARSVDGDFPRADASGAFTTALDVKRTIHPYGGDFATALNAEDPATTTTPPGSTTTTAANERETDTTARCTTAGGGCSIVIAAAADTKRSAVLPYVVAS